MAYSAPLTDFLVVSAQVSVVIRRIPSAPGVGGGPSTFRRSAAARVGIRQLGRGHVGTGKKEMENLFPCIVHFFVACFCAIDVLPRLLWHVGTTW